MQTNESLKPHFTERINNPTLPVAEKVPHKDKEKSWVGKIGTAFADTIRDIGTANQMAADKFDGDSALMHTARGFISGAIGAGLEKGTDALWDRVWRGEEPIFDKFKLGKDVNDNLNTFGMEHPRMYHLIKEGTQDLSIGALYNFIAFRSQPLLPKTEAKHLMGAVVGDVVEAMAPGLDAEVKTKIAEPKIKNLTSELEEANRLYREKRGSFTGRGDKDQRKQLREAKHNIESTTAKIENLTFPKTPDGRVVGFLRDALNLSNPVTILGADMVLTGVTTLAKNFKEVRKVRNEKGGLAGKKVLMPKKEGWQNRNDRREKWQPNKDKVYFGRSNMTPKQQEEYDLKSDI